MRRSPYHSLPAQVKNAIKELKESDNLLKDEDVLISVKRHAIETEAPRHRRDAPRDFSDGLCTQVLAEKRKYQHKGSKYTLNLH